MNNRPNLGNNNNNGNNNMLRQSNDADDKTGAFSGRAARPDKDNRPTGQWTDCMKCIESYLFHRNNNNDTKRRQNQNTRLVSIKAVGLFKLTNERRH